MEKEINEAAAELEAKVKVRVTNVIATIKDYRKTSKKNKRNAWLALAITILFLVLNAIFEVHEMPIASAASLVLYALAFIALLNFDTKADTARGQAEGALMVLETLLPEAFLEDDKTASV